MKYYLKAFIAIVLLACTIFAFSRDHSYIEGQLLIQLEKNANVQDISRDFNNYGVREINLVSQPMHIWLIEFNPNTIEVADLIRKMSEHGSVRIAQTNHKINLRSTIPNDPSFTSQWHHLNTGSGGTADADIDSDEAWDITTGGLSANGDEIVVCVVEGADLTHPDLNGNAWFNTNEIPSNGIDDDNNGYVDDYNGWNVASNNDNVYSGSHGTQVAGMIGSKGNNNLGVTGANWNVKIMVVAGQSALDEASVIAAYTYPFIMRKLYNQSNGSEGAFVVATNASWGIDGGDPVTAPLWCAFYDSLGKEGILNCGATANNSVNVDIVGDLPTACPSDFMVSVTATNNNDNRTFSAYGSATIDLGAPGSSVYTTFSNGTYGSASGTSFASPLTAGVIGLLYSIPCPSFMDLVNSDPRSAALTVRQALLNGVDTVGNLPGNTVSGGRVNMNNSLNILLNSFGCGNISTCQSPLGFSVTSTTSSEAYLSWTPSSGAIGYVISYRKTDDILWIVDTVIISQISLSGLTPCTAYEFQVQSICDSNISGSNTTYTFNTGGCANCQINSYCSSNSNNNNEEWISNVNIGNLNNNSTSGSGGYEDFTSISATYIMGSTYQLSISPSYSGSNYTEYFRVWIDYNQDGDFEDIGELAFDPGIGVSSTISGMLTIPVDVPEGATRMRVSMKWNSNPLSCESFSYGEVEDYCVVIASDENCSIPPNHYTDNISYNAARLNWTVVQGADHYVIRGRQSGTGAYVTIPVAGGTTDQFNVNTLAPGKTYEWEIMTSCNASSSNSSLWSGLTSFSTLMCEPVSQHYTTNVGSNFAKLNWSAVPGATGYKIQGRVKGPYSLTSINVAAAATSFNVYSLSLNTTYEWKIRANCPGGASSYTTYAEFTTSANLKTLALPDAGSDLIKVYPNPASDKFKIDCSKISADNNLEISLFDVNGRLVKEFRLLPGLDFMEISGLSQGFYKLVVKSNFSVYSEKIIVL